MSKPEIEWKCSLKDKEKFKDLKKEIYRNKEIKSVGILQWFINTKLTDGYERLRLEIFKEMDTYRHSWTYCRKTKIKKENTTEKEDTAEKRDEIELTIDMGNTLDKPDYMSQEAYLSIEKTKETLSELNKYPAVFKIRHMLNDVTSGFEFILDELVKIDDYEYGSITHIMEIEKKDENKTFDIDKILQESFVNKILSHEDMEFHSSKSNISESYKNKDIAINAHNKYEKNVPSAQRVISYIENMMMGSVYVVAMQGFSISYGFLDNITKDKKHIRYELKQNMGDDYSQYVNDKTYEPGTREGTKSCAELDSLYLLENDGFKIEKIYYFVFPDIEKTNDVRFFNQKQKLPEVYEGLEHFTKQFFKIECEAIPVEYSTQSRKMINNTFKEVWEKLGEIIEDENKSGLNRQIIMDITSGQKYPGIIAAMYCMFNQLPFYYKQERSGNLIKFPAVPVNWDNVKIDGYNTALKNVSSRKVEKNMQNIDYSEYISLPQGVKNLFNFAEKTEEKDDAEMISVITLSSIMDTYENARKLPFGYGEKLINHIDDDTDHKKWKDFIIDKIRDKWSLQWIGDQIPETVEHSQRHSKRLMEFAHNLINIIGEDTFLQGVPKDLRNEFYFILAVAMNVHDLGHTNSVWIFDNDRKMFLDGLPGVVRDLHNELTVQMLDKNKRGNEFNLLEGIEVLFKNDEERLRNIKKAITLICKYHRGYLKIEDGQGGKDKSFVETFDLNIIPLQTILEREFSDGNWRQMVKTAAQWLRFIDGTDVQSDRALSKNYTEIRSERTAMEALNIAEELIATQPEFIADIKLTFDIQQSLKWLNEIKREINDELRFEELGEKLGKKGALIEKQVYETLSEIIKKGTDKEYYSVPFELKQLAKFAFKIRQFPHFKKHAAVKMVYPRFYREKHPDERKKGKLFITYILEEKNDKLAQKLKDDVIDEFKTALITSIPGKGVKSLEITVGINKEEKA